MADKNPKVKSKDKVAKEAAEDLKENQNEEEKNGEVSSQNGDLPEEPVEPVEPIELPPFEVITGDRIDPFAFKFQYKNVEYSSGRNKTFLCYLVAKGNSADGLLRGFLEDEHASDHAEEAFFTLCLTHIDPELKYNITWYVSSSPCPTCSLKIAEVLKAKTNLKLSIFASRLLDWEEVEIQEGLKALHRVGCKLRVMKPLDFSYLWDTFVETDDQPLNLWEDCKENYEFYHDKLADILQ
ncbi:probable C-_U-editing enzyme APOBEC-2 [Cololabis saira]|uniref:probable C->U-editing enzyme APOBEC-2 n=1 Tax=Cololabis saira TaxID=129043 RepID=UPI002AD5AB4D|nr:probable C->U-editing enzyme APOBEC-2 [Cololabis saira]